ncbi:MAG: serine hydrolase [Bacteroidota bacterium]
MKKICSTFLLMLMIALSVPLKAQLPANLQNRLAFVLDSVCSKHNIKGASVAVLIPDNGIWKGTYGESHTGHPITPDMDFYIASNTKTYIAALMLKLQEMGKVDLDDTIGTWMHNINNVNGQITIRQLLNHTSGLGDYDYGAEYEQKIFSDFTRIWKPEELLVTFPVSAPKFAPGKGWSYTNTNFTVAGLIIKAVMNQPLSKSLRDLIFTPQQLEHTLFFPEEHAMVTSFPHVWSANNSKNVLVDFVAELNYSNNSLLSSGYGCGGMVTTAEDNVKFWHKLISGQIINPASFAEMTEYIQLKGNWKYGLGIYRGQKDINKRVVYEHGGTNVGFVCENLVDSISGVCVSVLTNQDSVKNDILLLKAVGALHKVTLDMPVSTGIEERFNNNINIQVYPNPAAESIHIKTEGFNAEMLTEMYNLAGEKVLSQQFSGGATTIAVGTLPAGLYIIHVTGANGRLSGYKKIHVIK